ncbi:MAG: bifunctional diguanylate cyclase/phosphodiesterase [Gammaproteobacteria bacterium]|nr:bifunctional diguanylate cyclase/phosphodiesterase [Gammaproteobacteria bacterium]
MMKFLQTVFEIKSLLLLCLLLCFAQPAFSAGGKDVKTAQKHVDSGILQLNQDEKKWVDGHRSIKIGYDGSLPPYSFINEQGVIDGIAVEIMALLSQRIGAEFIIYPDSNWNSLYRAAAKKKVDVIAAMVNRSDRAKWFNFTKPYLTKSLVIVTRQDNAAIANRGDLAGKRVAVVKGYRYVEQMGTEFPTAVTVKLDSMLESLKLVDQGKVDAAILFLGTANYLQAKHKLTKLKIAAFYERNSADESIAVRKDWPKLAGVLQKGLDSLTDQEVERIFSKWVVRGGVDGSQKNAVLNRNSSADEAVGASAAMPDSSAKSGIEQKPDIFDVPKELINPSRDALEIGKMVIVFLVVLTLFVLWLLLTKKQKKARSQAKTRADTRSTVRNLQADHLDDMHLTIVPMREDDESLLESVPEAEIEQPVPAEPVLTKADLEAIVPAPIALNPHKLAQEKQAEFLSTEQISYQRDEDGNFSFISPSIKTVLGYSEAHFMANYLNYLTPNPINKELDEFIEKSIQGQPNQICEIEIYDADRDTHWLKVTGSAIYNGLGHCIGIQGTMLDITSEKLYGKKAANAPEIEGDAIKTNLSQTFHESLQEAIYRAEKIGNQCSVIFLSLERMRFLDGGVVNPPPEEVLKEAGKRLRATLRDSDKIIDIDADKFALILPETTEKSAKLIGEKIRKILQVPYLVGVQSIVMDTALGFAAYPDHGADPESLIKKAQITAISHPVEVAAAKNKKPAEEHLSDDASLQLQQDLVYALDECKVALRSTSQNNIKVLNRHSQFVLHYQSRHSLADYSINGFEALIRWQHPELGLLMPRDFVDLVKDIGLLDVMTYWIIQQVSFQALDWEKKDVKPGVLAVNLGDLTIKQAVQVTKIADIVRETGAKPEWLTFSIQEQDLVKDMELVTSVVQQLTAAGFQVGIDNLKSEAILDDIRQLPVQVIEIEPALMRYLPGDADNGKLVARLMTALRDMGKTILAKEIESEHQLEFLRNNGCEVIQGHLLSRPMPAKEAKELMENLPDFAWYLKQ